MRPANDPRPEDDVRRELQTRHSHWLWGAAKNQPGPWRLVQPTKIFQLLWGVL